MATRFRYFLPYLLRRRWWLLFLAILIFISTALEGVGIGLFYPLVEYIQKGSGFFDNPVARRLFDVLGVVGLVPSIELFIFAIFAVIVMTLVVRYGTVVLSAAFFNRFIADLRDEAFYRILSSHLFYFYSTSSASLSQTVEEETEYLGLALNFLNNLMMNGLLILVYTLAMLFVSWKLTLLVLVLGGLRYVVAGIFIRKARLLGQEYSFLKTRMKSMLISTHQGIDVIKSFGAEKRESAHFKSLIERFCLNGENVAKTSAVNALLEGIFGDGLLCLIVYFSVSKLSISGAALLVFLFILIRIIPKVSGVNDSRIRISEYLARIQRLPGVFADAGLPLLQWGIISKNSFEDRIRLENISFRYPGREKFSLVDVNLEIWKNETIAIVGESGAGKTTLARILLRLFDPASGCVTIDGLPYSALCREDWVRLVSVVSQDTFIFDDTLENNVRYGTPDALGEDFRKALRLSRCDEFVEALPDKEKTFLGERGVRLSGGQRQRIAIARAFLRNSPILILDEATSSVDAVTEKLIRDAVKELSRDRTMIIIAHRFTTIRDANRIFVLDKGRLIEQGTHEDLIKTSSLYRQFYELQARERPAAV